MQLLRRKRGPVEFKNACRACAVKLGPLKAGAVIKDFGREIDPFEVNQGSKPKEKIKNENEQSGPPES